MPAPDGIAFAVARARDRRTREVALRVPGRHNVANALAALGAGARRRRPAGRGRRGARRLHAACGGGSRSWAAPNGVTVIDDFAHNPDKIAATLATLHAFPGRLLVMFQPHGYGPLKLMKDAFIDCFARHLRADDVLLMPEPVYFGGTADRSVTSARYRRAASPRAAARPSPSPTAPPAATTLLELARPGDRIVVMGARDDTLSQFAAELLARL